MKILFAVGISLLFIFTSCKKETAETKPVENAIKTVSFDELFGNKFENTNKKVAVEGLCVHVCKHSGKKIFIIGTDPDSKLQIYAGEGLSGFPQDLEGSKVRVIGVLEEEKLDMDYVNQMEEDLKTEEKEQAKSTTKTCVVEDEMKKIKNLRDKINQSPKKYFSLYSMTSTEFKKL
jgi:hypothetical protein